MPLLNDQPGVANTQDMHAAQFKGPQSAKPSANNNSPEENKLISKCQSMLQRGKKHRDLYSKDWEKCRKFYEGEQWYDQRRPSYRPSPVINVVWPTVNTIHPIMTDIYPGFDVGPTEPSDYKFAEMMSHLVHHWWKRDSVSMTISDAIMDALQITHGILKVTWDSEKQQNTGDVAVTCLDPGVVLIPEDAVDFETKCPWTIHIMRKKVGELKRMFPDNAERIHQTYQTNILNSNYDGQNQDQNNQWKTRTESGEAVLVSPIDRKDPRQGSGAVDVSGTGGAVDEQYVEVCEIWMDDWAIVEEKNEETGEPVKKKKFPKGRLVTVSFDLQLVLQDKQNPRADGRKPFVRVVDLAKPRTFAGTGEVKPLIEIQRYINKAWAGIMDWLNNMSNPVWVLDNTSGVSPRMITNQVGLVLVKNAGSTVTRLDAPQFPPQLMDVYNSLREVADTTSGVHDVTQGRRPTGITAAEAIDELQEAAQTRIRAKERNLEASMTDLGQLVIATMLQYYRSPRVVKIAGTDQGWPEFFEFYITDTEDGKYRFNRREFTFDGESKGYKPGNWEDLGVSKGIYDVEVIAGTSMPYQKNRKVSQAIQLFDRGAIDQKSLLDTVEWPEREETMQRMQEAAQQQVEVDMAAQGAPV